VAPAVKDEVDRAVQKVLDLERLTLGCFVQLRQADLDCIANLGARLHELVRVGAIEVGNATQTVDVVDCNFHQHPIGR
jgi:hypothetical protein